MKHCPLWFTAAVVAGTLPALAHFPIAIPERPFPERGEATRLIYAFGHPYEATRADAPPLAGAWLCAPSGAREALAPQAHSAQGAKAWALEYTPKERGDHLLVLQTKPLSHGEQTLQDFVKVVIPVGGVQRGWDRSLGLELELVPLTRPYGLAPGAHLRVEVQAKGKPVPGARVEVERLNLQAPATLPPEPFITGVEKANGQGELAATLSAPGWWVLACEVEGPDGVHRRASLWVLVGEG